MRSNHAMATSAAPKQPVLTEYGTVFGGSCASDGAIASFAAWHGAVAVASSGGDAAPLLRPVMHSSCVFRPPTYFTPWKGGEECMCRYELAVVSSN